MRYIESVRYGDEGGGVAVRVMGVWWSGGVDMRCTNDLSGGTGTAVIMKHELYPLFLFPIKTKLVRLISMCEVAVIDIELFRTSSKAGGPNPCTKAIDKILRHPTTLTYLQESQEEQHILVAKTFEYYHDED